VEIKQIIPSDGWWVVSLRNDLDHPLLFRIICWALIEDEEGQHVTPMIEGNVGHIVPARTLLRPWHYSYGHTYEEAYEEPKHLFDELRKLANRMNGKEVV
jgi:hypothetical protein